jgi:asparagine synthase (glutamine-hydrolysing)
MSNFAGLWRLDGRPVGEDDIGRLTQALEARGIADARVWRCGPVGLVHRQHVFAPEDAAERLPLVGDSGQVLVADVHLTDRPTLLAALGLAVEPGQVWSDGALMLAAVERWGGEAALSRFYGDFAFALWDPQAERLSLARAPLSRRTLYVHRGPRLVAFATRLPALLALPEVPRDLDERAIADEFINNWSRQERTAYRGIDRVPMGHLAVLSAADTRVAAWWSQPQPGTLRHGSDAEVEEAATEVLDRAVGGALRANGPVTAHLTGGLDTAAIVTTAARLRAPERLNVVTRVPSGPIARNTEKTYHDESPRAQALAALYPNVDWHRVGDDCGDWGETDPQRGFEAGGLPGRWPVNVAWFYPLHRFMAARGSRVALAGGCGNGYFSYNGDPLLWTLFRRLRWGALARELQASARINGQSPARLFLRHIVAPMEPMSLRLRRKGLPAEPWGQFCPINPAIAAELRLKDSLDAKAYKMRLIGNLHSAELWRRWACEGEWSADIVATDRTISGIDVRMPLADRRVVEFFGALPLEQFYRNGEGRSLARRLLAGRVPPQTLACRDRGKQNGDWFTLMSGQRNAYLADMPRLRASPLARRFIDLDRLQATLDDWPTDVEVAEKRRAEVWLMLQNGIHWARFLAWQESGEG